jgi:hypothetical protein
MLIDGATAIATIGAIDERQRLIQNSINHARTHTHFCLFYLNYYFFASLSLSLSLSLALLLSLSILSVFCRNYSIIKLLGLGLLKRVIN